MYSTRLRLRTKSMESDAHDSRWSTTMQVQSACRPATSRPHLPQPITSQMRPQCSCRWCNRRRSFLLLCPQSQGWSIVAAPASGAGPCCQSRLCCNATSSWRAAGSKPPGFAATTGRPLLQRHVPGKRRPGRSLLHRHRHLLCRSAQRTPPAVGRCPHRTRCRRMRTLGRMSPGCTACMGRAGERISELKACCCGKNEAH